MKSAWISLLGLPLLKKVTIPYGWLLIAWPSQLISFQCILHTDHPTMLSCTSLKSLNCTECLALLFLIEVLNSPPASANIYIHSLVPSWFAVQPTILKPPVRLSVWIKSWRICWGHVSSLPRVHGRSGYYWRSLMLTFNRQLIMEKDPNATDT